MNMTDVLRRCFGWSNSPKDRGEDAGGRYAVTVLFNEEADAAKFIEHIDGLVNGAASHAHT